MLQYHFSASSRTCMQTHIFMEEHYTICQHSMPFVQNGPMQFFSSVSQYTSNVIAVPCCMNSICRQHSFLVPENSFHRLSGRETMFVLNFLGLSALTALWFQHSQMKPRFHHLLLIRCD
jgi:hypothetical protein